MCRVNDDKLSSAIAYLVSTPDVLVSTSLRASNWATCAHHPNITAPEFNRLNAPSLCTSSRAETSVASALYST
jgi:hypothetical protein